MSNTKEVRGVTGAQYRFMDTSPDAQALAAALQQIMLGFSTLTTVISSLQQEIKQIKEKQNEQSIKSTR